MVTFPTLTVFLVTLKNILTEKPPTQSIEDSYAMLHMNNDLKRIKTQALRPFSCSNPALPPPPAMVTFRTLTVFLVTLKNFLTKKPPTQSIEDSYALLQFQ